MPWLIVAFAACDSPPPPRAAAAAPATVPWRAYVDITPIVRASTYPQGERLQYEVTPMRVATQEAAAAGWALEFDAAFARALGNAPGAPYLVTASFLGVKSLAYDQVIGEVLLSMTLRRRADNALMSTQLFTVSFQKEFAWRQAGGEVGGVLADFLRNEERTGNIKWPSRGATVWRDSFNEYAKTPPLLTSEALARLAGARCVYSPRMKTKNTQDVASLKGEDPNVKERRIAFREAFDAYIHGSDRAPRWVKNPNDCKDGVEVEVELTFLSSVGAVLKVSLRKGDRFFGAQTLYSVHCYSGAPIENLAQLGGIAVQDYLQAVTAN